MIVKIFTGLLIILLLSSCASGSPLPIVTPFACTTENIQGYGNEVFPISSRLALKVLDLLDALLAQSGVEQTASQADTYARELRQVTAPDCLQEAQTLFNQASLDMQRAIDHFVEGNLDNGRNWFDIAMSELQQGYAKAEALGAFGQLQECEPFCD